MFHTFTNWFPIKQHGEVCFTEPVTFSTDRHKRNNSSLIRITGTSVDTRFLIELLNDNVTYAW